MKQGRILPEQLWEGLDPANTVISNTLVSGTVREYISVSLAIKSVVLCCKSPQKLMQSLATQCKEEPRERLSPLPWKKWVTVKLTFSPFVEWARLTSQKALLSLCKVSTLSGEQTRLTQTTKPPTAETKEYEFSVFKNITKSSREKESTKGKPQQSRWEAKFDPQSLQVSSVSETA